MLRLWRQPALTSIEGDNAYGDGVDVFSTDRLWDKLQRTPVLQRHFIQVAQTHETMSWPSSPLAERFNLSYLSRSVLGRLLSLTVKMASLKITKQI